MLYLSDIPELKLELNDKPYICIHSHKQIHMHTHTYVYLHAGMPELKLGLNDKLLFESQHRSTGKVC